MAVLLKLNAKIAVYCLAYSNVIYFSLMNRNPCIMVCIVSPDSCQYTVLLEALKELYETQKEWVKDKSVMFSDTERKKWRECVCEREMICGISGHTF